MVTQPLVTVLMTAYNREKFIADAIESVLASTYQKFELIVVDDCSSDKTVEIARKYEQRDARVQVFVNDSNLGDYPNRNKAAQYAKGEYLMNVDSDDMVLKDGIEKCVATMCHFTTAHFGMFSFDKVATPYLLAPKLAIKKHFFEKPFLHIGPGGTIIRRSFFESIKGYPEKYGPANDMFFNLKAACFSPIVMLPFEFVYYRRHEGQEINNKYAYLINNYRYLSDALIELPLQLKEKEIKWLHKKKNRRFLVNLINYFLKTKSISQTQEVIKKTGFGLRDAFTGLFH